MNEPTAFQRLNPIIQEELYRMKWTALRSIQVDAIHAILGGNKHLIISANTAGGKTEAAFLPILSEIVEDHTSSVRALYVGPLKALINDQFRRLEELWVVKDYTVGIKYVNIICYPTRDSNGEKRAKTQVQ